MIKFSYFLETFDAKSGRRFETTASAEGKRAPENSQPAHHTFARRRHNQRPE